MIILSLILSGNNRELDSADIKNWLNYSVVTSYKPRLSLLTMSGSNIENIKGQTVISVCSLIDESMSSALNVNVEYQAVGYINQDIKRALQLNGPTHALIVSGAFNTTISNLNKLIENYEATRSTVIDKQIVSGSERITDDGLVL